MTATRTTRGKASTKASTRTTRKPAVVAAPVIDDKTRRLEEQLNRLLDPVQHNPMSLAPRRDRKAQWTPGVTIEGDEGTIVSKPMPDEQVADWSELLIGYGLDPNEFQIVEPVFFNKWDAQTPDGMTVMKQAKAKVVRRVRSNGADLDSLIASIDRFKPRKVERLEGEGVFNVVLGDWQTGKSEGGGSIALLARVQDAIDLVEKRIKELRTLKRDVGVLQVIWTGDAVESCVGHYAMQTFQTDLDRREQVKVTRRLLAEALMRWAPLFSEVRVVAVGGNHGENRIKGKAFTTFTDNDDLAIVEGVAEAFALNPDKFGHIRFNIAKDGLTTTVETAGWILGVTHGHTALRGSGPEGKLKAWYAAQAAGKQPIGDADILVTGHYHHFRIADWGGCVWLQCPALDGGSEWYKQISGEHSDPGTLTFCTYPTERVADLQLLR